MAVTLTGDNDYSGVYSNVDVLGGASNGGGTFEDTNAFVSLDPLATPLFPAGTEFFLFGDLSFRSTTISSNDVTLGTYNTTATGNSGDTLVFDFNFVPGNQTTSDFLTSSFALSGGTDNGGQPSLTADTDGDANWQSTADASAWTTQYAAWQASLGPNATYSNAQTIETGVTVNNPHPDQNDPDANITLNVTATVGGPPSLTSDHVGMKVLLGFAVGSDHLNFNGDSTITDAEFNQYFDVSASSHLSANNNTVNDTMISLDDHSWSVDLYGIDVGALTSAYNALHSTSLSTHDYVFDFILSH